jgi:hypothetical protein
LVTKSSWKTAQVPGGNIANEAVVRAPPDARYRQILVTEGIRRQRLELSIWRPPASLGGFGELEDHGERRLVREISLGAHRAVADRRERTLPIRFSHTPTTFRGYVY